MFFPLKVANYINGGHYNPHHDYVLKDKDPTHLIYKNDGVFVGDRIATFMFYVSILHMCRRRVFPPENFYIRTLDLQVFPQEH